MPKHAFFVNNWKVLLISYQWLNSFFVCVSVCVCVWVCGWVGGGARALDRGKWTSYFLYHLLPDPHFSYKLSATICCFYSKIFSTNIMQFFLIPGIQESCFPSFLPLLPIPLVPPTLLGSCVLPPSTSFLCNFFESTTFIQKHNTRSLQQYSYMNI